MPLMGEWSGPEWIDPLLSVAGRSLSARQLLEHLVDCSRQTLTDVSGLDVRREVFVVFFEDAVAGEEGWLLLEGQGLVC